MKTAIVRVRRILSGLLLVTVLTGCTVSPTGRQQLMLVGPGQLDGMGAQAFAQMQTEKPLIREAGLNGYVRCAADALTAELSSPYRWEVAVFRDDDINAFALPGGKIGVHTGLLRVATNQDQLAAVIGHEIGHVLANHANERMSQQLALQGGLALLGSAAGSPDSAGTQQLMQALGLGAQFGILMPYSRLHESEADRIGLDLMARAGFDPRESLTLWRNMAREGGAAPPEFLSTHPSSATRLRDLEGYLDRALAVYQQARARGRRPACG